MMLAKSLQSAAGNAAAEANYIESVFQTWLYTGNGSTQTITNGIDLAGEGGLVWIKDRSATTSHGLFDTARGVNNYLSSNSANEQNVFGVVTNALTAFNSNGFSVGTSLGWLNASGDNIASWTFRKQPKFFDVVTWSGDGTGNGRRLAHNLGSVPGCMIFKRTNLTGNWGVWHRTFSNPTDDYLNLNLTNAVASFSNTWGTSAPTATDFPVGSSNTAGQEFVAYLFAHDSGGFGESGEENVISCGSTTANGSGDFSVNLGYEPQWVLIKSTGSGIWSIVDNMRGATASSGYTSSQRLQPQSSAAEDTLNSGYGIGLNATGFTGNLATFSNDFIYIAIRRGPMKVPTDGTSVFAPATYTGNGANQTFTNTVNNSGSLVVIKGRNSTFPNVWYDQLRGAGNALASNSTSSALQAGATFEVSAFTNKGFSLGENFNYDVNNTGAPFVYWQFVRAPGFFDVVCYTGTQTARTINHNLGVAPELMITKNRLSAGFTAWLTCVPSIGMNNILSLNTSGATDDGWGSPFTSTPPTSSVFGLSSGQQRNETGVTYVAYLFASAPGVSKVGSYTGTGTTLQINCGFTGGARFIMVKSTSTTGDWIVVDTARGLVSGNDPTLALNSTAAEVTTNDWFDPYSAGFELSSVSGNLANTNGTSYIYLAIA